MWMCMALNRSKTLKRTPNSVQGRLIINSDKILDLMSQIREKKKLVDYSGLDIWHRVINISLYIFP